MKSKDEMIMAAGFDHPCKQTCSGWQQGYDRGVFDSKDKNPPPSVDADEAAKKWKDSASKFIFKDGFQAGFRDCAKWLLGHNVFNKLEDGLDEHNSFQPECAQHYELDNFLNDMRKLKAEVEGV